MSHLTRLLAKQRRDQQPHPQDTRAATGTDGNPQAKQKAKP